MKTINLTKITISNFKGISSFTGEFTDKTVISGANATGKTSLWDAFTWCLFGKNSEDKASFNIRPLDKDNNMVRRVDIEVAITLFVSENNIPGGESIVLKRVQKEKWVTRRGSAEEEFSGNETVYFWNDVPLSQSEYDLKVSSIMGDIGKVFKLISSPLYFNQMKWQDRRAILTSIAGEVSIPERFYELVQQIGSKTLDEYRKEIGAKKKRIKAELDTIPARIDEVKRSRPAVQDWVAVEKEIAETEAKLKDTLDEIANSGKAWDQANAQVLAYKKEVNALKDTISNLEYQGNKLFNNDYNDKKANIERVEREIERENQLKLNNKQLITDLTTRIKGNEKAMNELREEFMAVSAEQFILSEGQEYCPTCKQMLPEEQLSELSEKMQSNWNANKAKRLDAIRTTGIELKEENQKLQARIDNNVTERADRLTELMVELDTWKKMELLSVAKRLEGDKDYLAAKSKLAELEANPVAEVPADRNITNLKLRQSGYMDRINNLKATLSTREQIKASQDRESELLRQEKEFSQGLADLERVEFSIQEYVKYQVDEVTERVNTMFPGVQFKMFSDQINGGISETCETLVDGVPWQDANNAAKINSGLMIIDTLTRHFGVSAPIWVDNAESVNHVFHPEASQLILLYVTEDKVLTISK